MRRSSVARLQSQNSEPQIVIEDQEYEEETKRSLSSQHSSEDESPMMNPYLLSPYAREIRKHSLPTPQCSGITASQIRRLSDRGEAGPGPRQAEFLATLSQGPQVSPGGRRHSVVTISKAPPIFGRNRRESVAAFPTTGFPSRILPNRRESIACPPSTEARGSVHNLQLDIMDDIVQARKVRMKVWTTSSEKLCEVQPLDEPSGSGVQRYTNSGRRFSDFIGTTLPPIPSSTKRRASELPPLPSTSKLKSGIVCTNTDLISILSSLSTSAMEINQWEKEVPTPPPQQTARAKEKQSRLKSSRSNSFDVSVLLDTKPPNALKEQDDIKQSQTPSNWFAKRHQPRTGDLIEKKLFLENLSKKIVKKEPAKVVWDEKCGSLVDAQALGSAIEVFLRQSTPESPSTKEVPSSSSKGSKLADKVLGAANKVLGAANKSNWFSKGAEDDPSDTCDSSLCSTLKDLFVK